MMKPDASTAAPPQTSTAQSPLKLALESTTEWRVDYITYEGQEKYTAPPTYSEHVTRVAHTIDFSTLGNDSEYSAVDVNNLQYEIHDDDNPSNDEQKEDGSLLMAKIDESAQRRICTKLHESLIQLQVLHDVLATAREGRYLQLNYSEQFVDDYDGLPQRPVTATPAHERRAYMLTASRRVATEASHALQEAVKRLAPIASTPQQGVSTSGRIDDAYLSQLLELKRKFPRLRRLVDVEGDLAYSHSQRLFDASRTFKVRRCATPISIDGRIVPDMLTVVLPTQLQTPRTVVVDIVSEDTPHRHLPMVPMPRDHQFRWDRTLTLAQHTLLSIDLFNLLHAQLIEQFEKQTSAEGDESALALSSVPFDSTFNKDIYLQLDDCYRLRVSLVDVPFDYGRDKTSAEEDESTTHLTRFAYQQFAELHERRNNGAPICAAAPPAPDSRASALGKDGRPGRNRHIQESGALALTAASLIVLCHRESFVTRLRNAGRQTLLVRRWLSLLSEPSAEALAHDIHMSWQWLAVDRLASSMRVQLSVVGYDHLTRLRCRVDLSSKGGVTVLYANECTPIRCGSDVRSMRELLAQMRAQLLIRRSSASA